MSVDSRPTGTYDGPRGPAALKEIITRDMGELSASDKDAVKKATGAMIRYTAFGHTVTGFGLGLMLAFRGRYHPTRLRQLPKVFPNGFSQSPNPSEFRERVAFIVRSIAFGAAGVLVGQGVGFAAGSRKSQAIIHSEGNYENIERVMKKMQLDVQQEMGKGRPMTDQQRRKLQGPAGVSVGGRRTEPSGGEDFMDGAQHSQRDAGDESRLARAFESDNAPATSGSGSTGRSGAWGETPFAKELGNDTRRSDETAFSSIDATPAINADAENDKPSSGKRNRWEELRGQRDSRDSAWERIRQDRARQTYNSSRRSSSSEDGSRTPENDFGDGDGASFGGDEEVRRAEDDRRKREEREKQRRDYERAFEKESKGEDLM